MRKVIIVGTEYFMPIRYGYTKWLDSIWKRVNRFVFHIDCYKCLTDNFIECNYPEMTISTSYTYSYELFLNVVRNKLGICNLSPDDISRCANIMKESLNECVSVTPNLSKAFRDKEEQGIDVLLVGDITLKERDFLQRVCPEVCLHTVLSCDHGCDVIDWDFISQYIGDRYSREALEIHMFSARKTLTEQNKIDCSLWVTDVTAAQNGVAVGLGNV